jgi:hypothetical protein
MLLALLLLFGWCGVALAAAMLMGRFIAAGKGESGLECQAVASKAPRDEATVRTGSREAA